MTNIDPRWIVNFLKCCSAGGDDVAEIHHMVFCYCHLIVLVLPSGFFGNPLSKSTIIYWVVSTGDLDSSEPKRYNRPQMQTYRLR